MVRCRLKTSYAYGSTDLISGTDERSDEAYIVSLCDEALKLSASRQHTFEFLRGDPDKHGRTRRLPVDAYYAELKLVVEYHERQHAEAHSFFDKPGRLTVSGVHRGEQRKLYDQRRRNLLPKHGIELVEFSVGDFAYDKRGRLLRKRAEDMAVVERKLREWLELGRERSLRLGCS